MQPGKQEGKETDATEAPPARSSAACFTRNLIYGADLGKYKKKTQYVLATGWNGETRDTVKRNTPVFQVWATKSRDAVRKWGGGRSGLNGAEWERPGVLTPSETPRILQESKTQSVVDDSFF